mgnify:CR=1 FL=1
MNTSIYRTRTEWVPKVYEKIKRNDDYWVIGLDSGYGGMKGFSPNKYFCFPSYARLLEKDKSMMTMYDRQDVIYEDLDTGEIYLLGRNAQNSISRNDINDTDNELFNRKRFKNKKFYVLCMAAIGLAAMPNQKHSDFHGIGKEIVIQAGLPPAYLEMDREPYIHMFSRAANYRLKVGKNPWLEFHIAIDPKNVYVMAQPSGTMASINIGNNGQYIPEARNYLTGNVLILDIGFHTMDVFGMKGHVRSINESFDRFGMRSILQMVSDEIKKEKNTEIRVSCMQKYLEKGYIDILDEETMKTESVQIAPLLEKASEMVFQEAVAALKNMTNFMRDYDVLIPTGGTCSLWMDKFMEHFKDMKSLTVIPGNRNDKLPLLYSNVRGYYMFCYMSVKAGV